MPTAEDALEGLRDLAQTLADSTNKEMDAAQGDPVKLADATGAHNAYQGILDTIDYLKGQGFDPDPAIAAASEPVAVASAGVEVIEPERSRDYLVYLERCYIDIKQVLEAVLSTYPPAVLEENQLVETLVGEFDYLGDLLGYEDMEALLSRVIGSDNDDDALHGLEDREIPPDYEN